MKKYDLSSIMSAVWRIFRKGVQSFAMALRMAWANAKAHREGESVEEAKDCLHKQKKQA